MLKARLPGPGTPVVVYGDTSGTCGADARWREWRVVAEVTAGDEAAWERALTQLLEQQAHVLVVPGPQTVGETPDIRDRRIRDVALRHARLFYAESKRFDTSLVWARRSPRQ